MIDAEDIVTSLIGYLTEDVGGGVSRINQAIIDANICKGDSLLPPVSDDIILQQRMQETDVLKDGYLGIDIKNDIPADSNYDEVASTYEVTVSYVRKDSFAQEIFLAALRMEGVIKRVMEKYFDEKVEGGFNEGKILESFVPERVLLGNTTEKAILSGVIYSITIE